jgi:GNAT superfamily N-acetyltransferase
MELFVSASGRGSGVGRALMAALIDLALERGYSRLEWTTEAHNSSAQEFYRRYDAAEVNRVFYRLDRKSLQGKASGNKR